METRVNTNWTKKRKVLDSKYTFIKVEVKQVGPCVEKHTPHVGGTFDVADKVSEPV